MNTIRHNKETEGIYIREFSEIVRTEEEVIKALKEGKHIFYCENEEIVKIAIDKTPLNHYSIIKEGVMKTLGDIHKIKSDLVSLSLTKRNKFKELTKYFNEVNL